MLISLIFKGHETKSSDYDNKSPGLLTLGVEDYSSEASVSAYGKLSDQRTFPTVLHRLMFVCFSLQHQRL